MKIEQQALENIRKRQMDYGKDRNGFYNWSPSTEVFIEKVIEEYEKLKYIESIKHKKITEK